MRILREYERGVVFQLGRFWTVKGPGLILLIPVVQQMVRVDLRTVVLDVPPQDVITRDNVSVKVNAVVYFRVVDPQKAMIQVANFLEATSQLAQTTLRAVLGKHELDELLAEREKLNIDIQRVLDEQTDAWGIKVSNVEIKHVDLNETMVRAIARQAEAERERRAKVIHAEGELQASEKLLQAAQMLCAARRGDAAALPADAHADRRRQVLDHRVSRCRWTSSARCCRSPENPEKQAAGRAPSHSPGRSSSSTHAARPYVARATLKPALRCRPTATWRTCSACCSSWLRTNSCSRTCRRPRRSPSSSRRTRRGSPCRRGSCRPC